MRQLLRLIYVGLLLSLFSCQSYADDIFRVVSQNMFRLYDDQGNGKKYETLLSTSKFNRRTKLASHKVINDFKLPDIIALQEVENLNTLNQIIRHIRQTAGVQYKAILKEGNDLSGINSGYLIKAKYHIKAIKQLFQNERLKLDDSYLFSRPPLFVQVCKQLNCISILNLHLRSMRGISRKPTGQWVSLKRLQQATAVARWIDEYQRTYPTDSLMVLGDFNALSPTDRYLDVVGTIRGIPDNRKTLLSSKDWIEDDLIDLTLRIPLDKRYSYIHRKNKQLVDYILVNKVFKPRLINIQLTRIDYGFSDHAGLIADFSW